MVEIIPAILVQDEAEFHAQVERVSPYVSLVQLDVVDGEFAPNVTWGEPRVVRSIQSGVRFEIDLMVNNPGKVVGDWALPATPISRIYFHQETAQGEELDIIKRIKEVGIEAGLSLVPETPLDNIYPFLQEVDAVLLLGVTPGFQGQAFQPSVLDNIRTLRASHPGLPIEVDGGVKPDNIRDIIDAGANRVAVGSFINQHPDGPDAAIRELQMHAAQVV